jgi:hypothetical protein
MSPPMRFSRHAIFRYATRVLNLNLRENDDIDQDLYQDIIREAGNILKAAQWLPPVARTMVASAGELARGTWQQGDSKEPIECRINEDVVFICSVNAHRLFVLTVVKLNAQALETLEDLLENEKRRPVEEVTESAPPSSEEPPSSISPRLAKVLNTRFNQAHDISKRLSIERLPPTYPVEVLYQSGLDASEHGLQTNILARAFSLVRRAQVTASKLVVHTDQAFMPFGELLTQQFPRFVETNVLQAKDVLPHLKYQQDYGVAPHLRRLLLGSHSFHEEVFRRLRPFIPEIPPTVRAPPQGKHLYLLDPHLEMTPPYCAVPFTVW